MNSSLHENTARNCSSIQNEIMVFQLKHILSYVRYLQYEKLQNNKKVVLKEITFLLLVA